MAGCFYGVFVWCSWRNVSVGKSGRMCWSLVVRGSPCLYGFWDLRKDMFIKPLLTF